MNLHLHVKTCYFEQIKSGKKTEEYREDNAYWQKKLLGRSYDKVVIYNAYKPGAENRIEFPFTGWHRQYLTHPHFGPDPVLVFAIHLRKQ